MKRKTLSVCMIVRDGEKKIRACLESVKKIADEIIVVDTGSQDQTIQIAKSFGAKVVETTWNKDFSEARNFSLEYATKDWVLIIDDDERLEEQEAQAIGRLLREATDYKGYYLKLINVIEGIEVSESIVMRLFENNPQHRFSGKIHEQIIRCLQEQHGDDCIGQTTIRILHYGYDEKLADIQKKYDRNLDILLTYEEEEKDGYYYYILGNEYMRMDDLEKALAVYEQSLVKTDYKKYTYVYFPYLIMNIAKIHCGLQNYQQMIEHVRKYLEVMPYFKDLYFMLVVAYAECKKFTAAKVALEQYRSCPEGKYEYPINHFEEMNNLDDLAQQLAVSAIRREEKLLDAYVLIQDEHEGLIETILSINEMVNQVYVVASSGQYSQLIKQAVQMGAKWIEGADELSLIEVSQSEAEFVLYLKAGEKCPFISSQQILDALETTEADALYLDIQDKEQVEGEELRIIRLREGYYQMRAYQIGIEQGNIEEESLGITIQRI